MVHPKMSEKFSSGTINSKQLNKESAHAIFAVFFISDGCLIEGKFFLQHRETRKEMKTFYVME